MGTDCSCNVMEVTNLSFGENSDNDTSSSDTGDETEMEETNIEDTHNKYQKKMDRILVDVDDETEYVHSINSILIDSSGFLVSSSSAEPIPAPSPLEVIRNTNKMKKAQFISRPVHQQINMHKSKSSKYHIKEMYVDSDYNADEYDDDDVSSMEDDDEEDMEYCADDETESPLISPKSWTQNRVRLRSDSEEEKLNISTQPHLNNHTVHTDQFSAHSINISRRTRRREQISVPVMSPMHSRSFSFDIEQLVSIDNAENSDEYPIPMPLTPKNSITSPTTQEILTQSQSQFTHSVSMELLNFIDTNHNNSKLHESSKQCYHQKTSNDLLPDSNSFSSNVSNSPTTFV